MKRNMLGLVCAFTLLTAMAQARPGVGNQDFSNDVREQRLLLEQQHEENNLDIFKSGKSAFMYSIMACVGLTELKNQGQRTDEVLRNCLEQVRQHENFKVAYSMLESSYSLSLKRLRYDLKSVLGCLKSKASIVWFANHNNGANRQLNADKETLVKCGFSKVEVYPELQRLNVDSSGDVGHSPHALRHPLLN